MTTLKREQLSELLSLRVTPCLSMYFPVHRAEPQRGRDRARFHDLLVHAADELRRAGVGAADADNILGGLEQLKSDETFWERCGGGGAAFAAADLLRVHPLPQRFSEIVVVAPRFYLRPLLPLLQDDGRFYILALTAEEARLHEATRYSIRPLSSCRIWRREPQGDLQCFFREVDEAVCSTLYHQNAPLVLACVGYLASLYEGANSYPQLVKGKVPGNPDIWSMDELRKQAWQLLEPRFRQRREQVAAAYRSLAGTQRASDDLREVVLAAGEGRVASLLIERGRTAWGNVDRKHNRVVVHPQHAARDDELLDYAASQTLSHGGDVYDLCEIPTDAPMAAIFRY
jgi:hypothetical protein